MSAFLSRGGTARLTQTTLTAVLVCRAIGGQPTAVEVQSGIISFEAPTNMPGIEVKGKSSALSAHVEMVRENNSLALEQIRATLPVKSLATGMKVRDEHMRRYIFTTADGNEPDLQFNAEPVTCSTAGAHEFNCVVNGLLSIRGLARPFSMQLHVKEQSATSLHANGEAVVKLSDYDIDPPSQFGVKPSNNVKFRLELTGKETTASASNTGGAR